jgi:hypothetical protein
MAYKNKADLLAYRKAYGKAHRAEREAACAKHRAANPEFVIYKYAKKRCTNPNCQTYKSYGAKGVRFLFESFRHFMAVLGRRPEGTTPSGLRPLYSLGRILDRGNYEPGNCFWMTLDEQNLAKRNNYSLRKWESANV